MSFVRCPVCEGRQIYFRLKTSNFLCRVCGHIFTKEDWEQKRLADIQKEKERAAYTEQHKNDKPMCDICNLVMIWNNEFKHYQCPTPGCKSGELKKYSWRNPNQK